MNVSGPHPHHYAKPGRELRSPGLSAMDLEVYTAMASACQTPVWAWGSRTRGYAAADSDYDVLIPRVHHSLAGRMRQRCLEVADRFGVKVDVAMVGLRDMPDQWTVEVCP